MSDKDDKISSLARCEDQQGIEDPIKILEILRDAILRKPGDRSDVAQALKQVLKQYEIQNRVFLIAAANAELPRIVRLLSFLNSCEAEMFKPTRIEDASTRELTRLYAVAQSNLISGLDNIKKVADMRLELMRAGGKDQVGNLFDGDTTELDAMAGMPGLDSTGRDRVRTLVSGLINAIDKDDSVVEDDDEFIEDDTAD